MQVLAPSLIIAFVFTCIFFSIHIQSVESESFETIYIRADGNVEGTDLIERNSDTYTFINDISGNIVISKDFITLDGSGYSLVGTDASSQKGISLSDRKNVTVTNMVIMNYFIGLSCGGTASNITFLNNYVGSCGIGIEFLGSSNHLVKFNTFKNNDIDIAINYVSGNNLITITYNNLNDYVQLWMSEHQTIDMNFWVDYNGTDSDGDGIGDSPYFYNEILQDNHPLMEPVMIPTLTPIPTHTPEPTSTPYEEPQHVEQEAILGVAVTVAVVCVGFSLLVYLIKRK
jgi:hypothetical protein